MNEGNHTTTGPKIGTVRNPYQVDSIELGYRLCRDLNRPVVVHSTSEHETARLFPSGRYEAIKE